MGNGVVGVVLAGGKGTRFTDEYPKQFVTLGDRPVLCHSVAAMEACDAVEAVCIVAPAEHIETVRDMARTFGFQKVFAVVPGGERRTDSTRAALAACEGRGFSRILLHDAARPLLTQDVLLRLIRALDDHRAVTAAVPVTDTVARADADERVADIPDRALLWQIQTPQGFDLYTLAEAYRLADASDAPAFTDDGGVVRYAFPDVAVKLVMGSRRLMKLTYPEDLALLTALL